jgi:nitroimidazol reductase NimA-like FMN-containing flavoprotein (pyridoxamine 5'-phosphate oxidase superfamily)
MIIEEMTGQEIKSLLQRATVGRLACSKDDQPYVVPLSFTYDVAYLYSLTTAGKKVDWMRANPKVCIEFDETAATNNWQSVLVRGIYEELTDAPEHIAARDGAHKILSKTPEWWQPAFVKTVIRDKVRDLTPVYFRISILETSGHKAIKHPN